MALTDASESQNFEEVVFATLLRKIVLFWPTKFLICAESGQPQVVR